MWVQYPHLFTSTPINIRVWKIRAGNTPDRVMKFKVDGEASKLSSDEAIDEAAGGDGECDADDVSCDGGTPDVAKGEPLCNLSVGDVVRAPGVSDVGVHGAEETLELVAPRDLGWLVKRVDFEYATVRQERRGDDEGWIVRQPLRHPTSKVSKWFSDKRHGEFAESEARKCKDEWDAQDSLALLVMENGEVREEPGSLRYSLEKARKCEESEVQALYGDQLRRGEGKAEWLRRCAAAKFNYNHARKPEGQATSCTEVEPDAVHSVGDNSV